MNNLYSIGKTKKSKAQNPSKVAMVPGETC